MTSKKKKEEPYRISLRLPKRVYDKIVVLATREKRSVNSQIVHECDKREVGNIEDN